MRVMNSGDFCPSITPFPMFAIEIDVLLICDVLRASQAPDRNYHRRAGRLTPSLETFLIRNFRRRHSVVSSKGRMMEKTGSSLRILVQLRLWEKKERPHSMLQT